MLLYASLFPCFGSFAQSKGVVVLSYSPFSAYPFVMRPTYDPVVLHVAAQLSHSLARPVSASQVLLKWAAQRGVASIPRSADAAHLSANIQALALPALSAKHMRLLDSLQHLVASAVCVPVELAN